MGIVLPAPPAHLATPRLLLRRPTPADAGPIFRNYAQDPAVVRYLSWRPHREVGETSDFLERLARQWDEGTAFTWVIAPGEDAENAVGMIGLSTERRHPHRLTFGFVLARSCWGRGYMGEALGRVVGWAFEQPEIWRVWSCCHVENRASARVMEKAGLSREGVARRWFVCPSLGAEPQDHLVYAKVRG